MKEVLAGVTARQAAARPIAAAHSIWEITAHIAVWEEVVRRGLGGEAAVEPFLVAGIALGDFDLLGEASYEWNVNAHVQGEREQVLTTGVAVGYRGFRGFTPLVELLTVSQTRGDGNEGLRGKTQVYVVPGLNRRLGPGTTARFGVQLPVADARRADYVLHGGLVWEF